MSNETPQIDRRETVVFEGQWVIVVKVEIVHNGHRQSWEIVRRKRCRGGVVILAQMIPSRRVILIKQHRPALGTTVLSLPAGLFDDDPERAAVRELKEETGYTGSVRRISPPIRGAAGFLDETAFFVEMTVDETAPQNTSPLQELEPEEHIEVLTPTLSEIPDLIKKCAKKGICISSSVWLLFSVAKRLWEEGV